MTTSNQAIRSPNLFLIGAPKCGTSALHRYLQSHPQIHLPRIKEPHYFCSDFPGLRRFPSHEEYLSLFREATTDHRYVGEATSRYLYSQDAVPNILESCPDARLIVMLRNPLELVPSLHNQLLYQFTETEDNLETAWRLQDARAHGNGVPTSCPCVDELMYGKVASLGSQIQRLLSTPGLRRDNLKIIFFDDFRKNAAAVYHHVLQFLDLPDDERCEFPRVNGNKSFRSAWVARMVVDPPFPLSTVKRGLKQTFGWKETAVGRWLYAKITVPSERSPLTAGMRNELCEYFHDDVRLLGELTSTDLSSWMKNTTDVAELATI